MNLHSSLQLNRINTPGHRFHVIKGALHSWTVLHSSTRKQLYRPCAAHTCLSGGGGGNVGGNGGSGSGGGEGDEPEESPQHRRPQLRLLLAAAALQGLAHPPVAAAARSESDAYVDKFTALIWPIVQNLGFSGIMGYVTGLALKVIGQTIAVALGVMFCVVQGLAYMGYIQVNWLKVSSGVVRLVDQDADGDFDSSDFKALLSRVLAFLSQGVPSVGGFAAGFFLALR